MGHYAEWVSTRRMPEQSRAQVVDSWGQIWVLILGTTQPARLRMPPQQLHFCIGSNDRQATDRHGPLPSIPVPIARSPLRSLHSPRHSLLRFSGRSHSLRPPRAPGHESIPRALSPRRPVEHGLLQVTGATSIKPTSTELDQWVRRRGLRGDGKQGRIWPLQSGRACISSHYWNLGAQCA